MGKCRKVFPFVLGLLLALLVAPSLAFASDAETVNVGLFESPHYAYVKDDGSLAGADVEYAYRIAQKSGFDINITLYENESDMLEGLNDGTVDMLFDFGKTAERQQNYLFSENPVGSSASTIYVRSDDGRFTYGDIDQLKDKVFGCSIGNNTGSYFQNWCANHGFTPLFREYESEAAVDAALDSGEIDAGVIAQNGHEGYTTILTFAPKPYYIIFRKDDTGLKNKVDTSMSQILTIDPLYEEKLLEKYGISTLGTAGFSAEEKEYIESHGNVRVAVVRNDSPYYWQSSDGQDEGIIPDYYEELAEFTGLSFSYQVYDTNADALAAVKDGQADLIAMFSDGVITAADEGLLLTDAYESVDSVMLTRVGTSTDEIARVAVKERSINNVRERIATITDAQIVPVANAEEGFEELESRKVDAVVCGLPSATWILNQTNSSAYSTSIISSMSFDLCGGVADGDSVLLSIMDKAIGATNYGFEGIVEDNTTQENNWQTTIARIPPMQIVIFAILLVVIILILVMALISMFRRQKEKAFISAAKAENERRQLQLETMAKNTEERNRFFSDVSHDMRTPLTAILGFSDLIDDETDLGKIKDDNRKIRDSGQLLLELIDDTLTLSKIGSNKLELRLVPVDSQQLFDPVIAPIKAAAERKGITLTVDRSHTLRRTILVDPLNVQKVMLNLLTNAVKYTPEGGHVELILRNEPEGSDDPDSIFIIHDDGIGMSEEFQRHMFEPFSQERRAGYGGTGSGLGLSIVEQLVTLMGGTIAVESGRNKGTTFTVRFHFQEARNLDDDAEHSGGSTSVDHGILMGKKVLLCEDNAMNREIATTLLESRGMTVVATENGLAGVESFSESEVGGYDAILMDIRMPVMDGYEATRTIRVLDRADAAAIPIIAMTADAFEDDIQRCLSVGMDGHLSKPIDPALLFGTLSTMLDRESSGRSDDTIRG